MRIYYVPMKILFAAISITAVAAAVMLFVLAAIKSRKAYIGKAVICCCIFAASAVGFALSSDTVRDDKISEVHVTVSPVKGTEAPESSIDPTLAPSAPAQAQGAYEASSRSDKFHLPSCSSPPTVFRSISSPFISSDSSTAASSGMTCSYFVVLLSSGKI